MIGVENTVSVIIANRNDLQMLLVTVLSAVEDLKGRGEVVVVDNSDEKYKECVKSLLSGQIKDKTVRLFHQEKPSSAAAMERAAKEAEGKYLFYTDSHTLVGQGTITALLRFFNRHQGEPIGFVHAPIQWAHNSKSARKVSFRLHRNVLGSWGKMIKKECKITWKGMPHMIEKETYHAIGGYGCLAENYVGWGGLIPYLGIKPWLLGYENWGIPYGVSYHFGEYPQVCREYTKYRLYGKHGDYPAGVSHAVACYVYGGEEFLKQNFIKAKMDRYFTDIGTAIAMAKKIGGEERNWIKENQKISIYELLENPPWGKDF
jgi:glycosyltransferase involved in cell wall biosynthesis